MPPALVELTRGGITRLLGDVEQAHDPTKAGVALDVKKDAGARSEPRGDGVIIVSVVVPTSDATRPFGLPLGVQLRDQGAPIVPHKASLVTNEELLGRQHQQRFIVVHGPR